MKFLKPLLITIFLHLILASTSFAGYTYIPLFQIALDQDVNNANPDTEREALAGYLNVEEDLLVFIDKYEDPLHSPFDFSSGGPIDYFVVKGSTAFHFYQIIADTDTPVSSISLPEIVELGISNTSHVVAWKFDGTPPDLPEVPEPATMFLFGFGLLGLAGFGRHKHKKK